MLYRIFPSKDTFITNCQRRYAQQTGSNFGSSEILHLYKIAGRSGAVGTPATSSIARILMQFDLAEVMNLTGSGKVNNSNITYFLKLLDANHDKTLPSSYSVEVQANSQSWDEGKGRDVDSFSDHGYANWIKPSLNSYWISTGSLGTGSVVVSEFDKGNENLEVNVTSIVNQWLSGTIVNNGFLIKLSSSYENDNFDHYIKMFHGRETYFNNKRPYLEARWDDHFNDDRNNFHFDISGTLMMYHTELGQLYNITDLTNVAVRIEDLSGTIKIVTGSHTGITGMYSASFLLASSSYSGSTFTDIWYNLNDPAIWYMTGTFGISNNDNVHTISPKRYYVNVVNLRNEYYNDELVRFNIFVRPHDYNPARVLTASSDCNGIIIPKAYYKIMDERTREVIVPFGTGTIEYTRLSYDEKGNYFDFYISSLSSGNVYKIILLFDIDGQRQYVDQGFKFKVL